MSSGAKVIFTWQESTIARNHSAGDRIILPACISDGNEKNACVFWFDVQNDSPTIFRYFRFALDWLAFDIQDI